MNKLRHISPMFMGWVGGTGLIVMGSIEGFGIIHLILAIASWGMISGAISIAKHELIIEVKEEDITL